jgi:NAD(P)-dependent dehydrogenase (short-subunit alcohol dehydrogenase family)
MNQEQSESSTSLPDQQARTVLITGAGGGIGRATVKLFTKKGWRVIGVDRAEFGEPFVKGGLYIQSDISIGENLESIFTQAQAFTGSLEALVNNAAVQIAKPLVETTVEEWDAVMASNLRSVFLGAKLAYPLLKAGRGGAIVNVSSVHAVATSANIAAYAASKGGLLALTRAIAIEFAPHNIRCNAILPGAVDTPMLRAGLGRGHVSGSDILERLDNLARRTVNGRVGRPEEIAHAIYFLADDEQSSFMTGQALIVDGGATARLSTE